jgi:Holliday junction resolvase-like predicted endonuclease
MRVGERDLGGYDYASLGSLSQRQLRRGRMAARRWLAEQGNRRPRAQEIRIDVVKVWFDTDGCLVDLQQLTLG